MSRFRGFSLLELLVAIAVIGLLIAISVPMLRSALRKTDVARDLANLRSNHQQFFEWGVEHKDRFVNQGPPPLGEPFVLRAGDASGSLQGGYSMQDTLWTWTLGAWLQQGYATWHPLRSRKPNEIEAAQWARLVGFRGGEHAYPSRFELSLAMLYDPRYFTPGCLDRPVSQYERFVRWSEVAFPGSKALLFCVTLDVQNQYVDSPMPFQPVAVTCDGSARTVDPANAIVIPGESCMSTPFGTTPLGVLGRDIP